MITLGVVGAPWRADLSPTGTIVPRDGARPLRWLIAADDRWHDPEREVAVRQHRRLGTAVVETRVRVPSGDIVETVWSVADHGGLTLVELRNDSPLPVAIALTRRDLLTSRAPASTAVAGIDAPPDSLVLPLAHRTSVTVALAHRSGGAGPLPSSVADADAVTRGWTQRTDAASRLELPDVDLVERVRAARVELMLAGPEALDPSDPVRFLVAAAELHRLGELTASRQDDLLGEIAAAAGRVVRATPDGAEAATRRAAALRAAARLFAAAGDQRAGADLARAVARRGDLAVGADAAVPTDVAIDDPLAIAAVESRLIVGATLFPAGIPAAWRGANLEANGLCCGPASTLDLALRWHGRHPALLWEVTGEPVELHAWVGATPWSSTDARGEVLWPLTDDDAAADPGVAATPTMA